MDGGRENRFLAGGAEISRMGGGITASPVYMDGYAQFTRLPMVDFGTPLFI